MRPLESRPPAVLGVKLKPQSVTHPEQRTPLPLAVTRVSKEICRDFPHSKKVGDYLIGKTIGRGSFARVKLGLHLLTAEKVAIKCIDKKKAKEDSYVRKHLRREGKIMSLLRHPHIIQLYEVMETPNSYYMVTELCEGGDLMDHIVNKGRLDEKEVRIHMRHIVSAVNHMHKAGVMHRDLKIENFLLNEKKDIKIIDFGLSNCFLSPTTTGCHGSYVPMASMCSTQCGSPAYAAPELLAHKQYGPQVDVWGMGVNMYAMLTGSLPFSCEPFNIKNLLAKMLNGDMNSIPGHLSRACKDFLKRLLVPDPDLRITLDQAMKHPWLSESDLGSHMPFISSKHHKLCSNDLSDKILQYMCSNLGCKLGDVIKMVTSNIPHRVTSIYHLLARRLARHEAEMRVTGKIAAAEHKMAITQRLEQDKKALQLKCTMAVPQQATPRCSTPKQPRPESSKRANVSAVTTAQLLDHLYYPVSTPQEKPTSSTSGQKPEQKGAVAHWARDHDVHNIGGGNQAFTGMAIYNTGQVDGLTKKLRETTRKEEQSKSLTQIPAKVDRWKYKKSTPPSKPLVKMINETSVPRKLTCNHRDVETEKPAVTVSPFICRKPASPCRNHTHDYIGSARKYYTSNDLPGGSFGPLSSPTSAHDTGKNSHSSMFSELPEVVKKYSTHKKHVHGAAQVRKNFKSPRYFSKKQTSDIPVRQATFT